MRPGTSSPRDFQRAGNPSSLLGLAPGGGYLAAVIAGCAGRLLPYLFTLTSLATSADCFCGPIRQLSLRCKPAAPDVLRRRALWSADFPLDESGFHRLASGRPANLGIPMLSYIYYQV